ncbi:hypothetical protein ACROYT_G016436 [Oculina patagonica]
MKQNHLNPLPLAKANRKQANLSVIQANRSAIEANWSAIEANRSAIEANWSAIEANRSAIWANWSGHPEWKAWKGSSGVDCFGVKHTLADHRHVHKRNVPYYHRDCTNFRDAGALHYSTGYLYVAQPEAKRILIVNPNRLEIVKTIDVPGSECGGNCHPPFGIAIHSEYNLLAIAAQSRLSGGESKVTMFKINGNLSNPSGISIEHYYTFLQLLTPPGQRKPDVRGVVFCGKRFAYADYNGAVWNYRLPDKFYWEWNDGRPAERSDLDFITDTKSRMNRLKGIAMDTMGNLFYSFEKVWSNGVSGVYMRMHDGRARRVQEWQEDVKIYGMTVDESGFLYRVEKHPSDESKCLEKYHYIPRLMEHCYFGHCKR